MYWEDLLLAEVGEWSARWMDSAPPPSVLFAPEDDQWRAASDLLRNRGLPGEATSSGTVQLRGSDPLTLWSMGLDYLRSTELERQLDEPELRTDEQPPKFVARQGLTRIAGLPSIGPGGRITVYDLPSGPFVDVSVRPLAELRGARGWRDPAGVQAAANGMVGAARGFRLRAAFGYSEPSAYEEAGLVRPAFVLVLDGPEAAGIPHWRVSIAVPATYDDDGDDGAASGRDSDWCV